MKNLFLSLLFRIHRPHFTWHFREVFGQEIMVICEWWLCFRVGSMERCISPGTRRDWELANKLAKEIFR
jgi:hypothetical protein